MVRTAPLLTSMDCEMLYGLHALVSVRSERTLPPRNPQATGNESSAAPESSVEATASATAPASAASAWTLTGPSGGSSGATSTMASGIGTARRSIVAAGPSADLRSCIIFGSCIIFDGAAGAAAHKKKWSAREHEDDRMLSESSHVCSFQSVRGWPRYAAGQTFYASVDSSPETCGREGLLAHSQSVRHVVVRATENVPGRRSHASSAMATTARPVASPHHRPASDWPWRKPMSQPRGKARR